MAGCFDYYAGLAEKLDERQGTPIDVGMEEFSVKVRREPLGVVALITPWNYPLLMATVSDCSPCHVLLLPTPFVFVHLHNVTHQHPGTTHSSWQLGASL